MVPAWDAELGQRAKSAARGALRWGRWPAAASRGGRRGEGGFCVAVPRLERRRRPRWERRRQGKGAGVGSLRALAAAAAAASAAQPRVCVPRGLQFMARAAAEGRRRGRKEAPGAAPQPTCPLARLARGSGAPGTTSRPAEMTRGLLPPKISLRSPRVRGARSTSPPPARRRAVPPPGPTAGAREACARACVPARARGRSSARQAARCEQLTRSPSRPGGPHSARPRARPEGRVRWSR